MSQQQQQQHHKVCKQRYPDFVWDWIPKQDTPALAFDIETDGLLDTVTQIHCICAQDCLTGQSFSFSPEHIEEGLNVLVSAPLLIAHNGLCFDYPVIQKLYPHITLPPLFDTLTASRLIWTNLAERDFATIRSPKTQSNFPPQLIGKHSLEAWGYRLDEFKGEYGKVTPNAWQNWSQDMQRYCEQDVNVLIKLYKYILSQEYSSEALALEHEFQKVIFQQEQCGVLFDVKGAEKLYMNLAGERAEISLNLQEAFPPKKIEEVFIPKVNNKTRGYTKGVPCIKVRYEEFNPNSRQQIAERLQTKYGWLPSEFTETGTPKVDEEVLKTLPYPECKPLIAYLELLKIIGMLAEGKNAWLKLVDSASYIHGAVITNGAVTGRCTHNSPNLAQIPARGHYGKLCRALFIAPPHYVQVGIDASGLELRMLAHYMGYYDNCEYVKILLNSDIHTANQKAAGLPTRDDAKRFIYCYLYGGGDAKLGEILAPDANVSTQSKKGRKARAAFLRSLPALNSLTEAIKATLTIPVSPSLKKRTFLYGLDGRKLHVRSAHSALNTLLQSAGAVLVKLATVIFHMEASKKGWVLGKDYMQVLHVHDEAQFYCTPDKAEELGKLFVYSIERAGTHFGLRCPTTGEYKIGSNWAETH